MTKRKEDFYGVGKRRVLSQKKFARLKARSRAWIRRRIQTASGEWMRVFQEILTTGEQFRADAKKWLSAKDVSAQGFSRCQYRILLAEKDYLLAKTWDKMWHVFGGIIRYPKIISELLTEAPREMMLAEQEATKYREQYSKLKKNWEVQEKLVLMAAQKKPELRKLEKELQALLLKVRETKARYNENIAGIEKETASKALDIWSQNQKIVIESEIACEEKRGEMLCFFHRLAINLNCEQSFIQELARRIHEQNAILISLRRTIAILEEGL